MGILEVLREIIGYLGVVVGALVIIYWLGRFIWTWIGVSLNSLLFKITSMEEITYYIKHRSKIREHIKNNKDE